MAAEFKYYKDDYFKLIQNNYFKPILDDVFSHHGDKIKRVADVGCGNGLFTAYLKEMHDIELIGFDASEFGVQESLKKGFDQAHVCRDFSEYPLPFEDNYFDFALNKDVLTYLMDPANLIKEVSRILKEEGLFLLHLPNDFNLWKRIQFVFVHNIDTYNYVPDGKEWNQPNIRFFTYKGIQELLDLNGFEIIKNYSAFFAHVGRMRYIPGCRRLLSWMADKNPTQFSQGITVLARKRKI